MEAVEVPAMVMALLLMFASVGAKVFTGQLISRMKHQISHVASIKQETLGRLKMVQSQKAVAVQNKGSLTTKKTKLSKRLNRLKKEMGTIKQKQRRAQAAHRNAQGRLAALRRSSQATRSTSRIPSPPRSPDLRIQPSRPRRSRRPLSI